MCRDLIASGPGDARRSRTDCTTFVNQCVFTRHFGTPFARSIRAVFTELYPLPVPAPSRSCSRFKSGDVPGSGEKNENAARVKQLRYIQSIRPESFWRNPTVRYSPGISKIFRLIPPFRYDTSTTLSSGLAVFHVLLPNA